MVKLRPFRGWRYNTDVVDDLASVICPPYDIIDRDLEESLRLRSPYNAVFLEGAERPDWNAAAADRYAQAAGLFQDWRQREVLRREAQPTFYLMEHTYSFQGRDLSRTGLICCVGLEDYQTRGVLAHELTQEPAVQDRVALMDSCNANFSPIMSLYRDPSGALFPALPSDYGRSSTHLSGARRFGPRYGPMVCNRPGRSGRHHRQIRKHLGVPRRWTPPVRGRAAFERAAPVLQRCRVRTRPRIL